MKKLLVIAIACTGLLLTSQAQAQIETAVQDTTAASKHYKEGVEDTQEEIKEGASEANAQVSKSDFEGAPTPVDTASQNSVQDAEHLSDKIEASKVGPQGQTIYVDSDSKYYYLNDQGNKVFIAKSELKSKE